MTRGRKMRIIDDNRVAQRRSIVPIRCATTGKILCSSKMLMPDRIKTIAMGRTDEIFATSFPAIKYPAESASRVTDIIEVQE